MSADYTKVYRGFFEGSLRDQSPYSKLLFLAMLLHADENGVVLGSVSFWADYVKCSQDEVRESLRVLSSPDPDSTTPDEEGRRIEPWGDGANRWRVVNYRKYYERSRNEERAEYKREWDRKHRETRHVSGSKRQNPTEPDRPDLERKRTRKEKKRDIRGVVGIVDALGYHALKDVAERYDRHRKENGWAIWKPSTCESKLEEWAQFTEREIGAALQKSVSEGWRGVFPSKEKGDSGTTYDQV